jgi:hypothetical protein
MNRACAVISAALCVTLAGCAQAGTDNRTRETTPSEPIRAECAGLVRHVGALAVVTGHLATGEATVNQVRSAAADLVDALEETGPDLPAAGRALRRVEQSLSARPVDTRTLRDATDDLLTELDNPSACPTRVTRESNVSGP